MHYGALTGLTVAEYARRTASAAGAPGGGSSAALSGLLGVSLIRLAAEVSASDCPACAACFPAADALASELAVLADRDAAALQALLAAMKEPSSAAAAQSAVLQAAQVPLATAQACWEGLRLARSLTGQLAPVVAGDLMAGVWQLLAGVQGALLSVAVNLPLLTETSQAAELQVRAEDISRAAKAEFAALRQWLYNQETYSWLRPGKE